MITDKAKQRAKILNFYQQYGLRPTLDAFTVKRSTLFLWQQKLKIGQGQLKVLNNQSRTPLVKRKRLWSTVVLTEIKQLRQEHPNLGKDKIYTLLQEFCVQNQLSCPSISTIERLIKDAGGLRSFPQKVSHFGKLKPIKKLKSLENLKIFKLTMLVI